MKKWLHDMKERARDMLWERIVTRPFRAVILAMVIGFLAGASIAGAMAAGSYIPAPLAEARAVSHRILNDDSPGANCSVVAVSPGLGITAAHCGSLAAGGKIVTDAGGEYAITQVEPHGAKDIALVTAPGLPCPCVKQADFAAVQDEAVVVVGYPFNLGQIVTYGAVQLRAIVEATDSAERFLIITAPVAPGNSGGGVFVVRNDTLYLVGIVSRMASRGPISLISELDR